MSTGSAGPSEMNVPVPVAPTACASTRPVRSSTVTSAKPCTKQSETPLLRSSKGRFTLPAAAPPANPAPSICVALHGGVPPGTSGAAGNSCAGFTYWWAAGSGCQGTYDFGVLATGDGEAHATAVATRARAISEPPEAPIYPPQRVTPRPS